MDAAFAIELFGYFGSALTIVSMLMTSVVKLRIINTAGSSISGIYALIIGSYPLAILSFSLVAINIYNLIRLSKSDKHYDLIIDQADSAFVRYFLERCHEDIRLHFPDFDRKAVQAETAYLICCNGDPAGVMLAKKSSDGTLDITLDYSTPTYRDCSVAKYLHTKLPANGIHTLLSSQSKTKNHVSYLKSMGFTEQGGVYVKKLK